MSREVMQKALEALEKLLLAVDIDTVRMLVDDEPFDAARTTLDALRAALAEQAEPSGETRADLYNALQRIDTVACMHPLFKVEVDGGLDACVENIVRLIERSAAPHAPAAAEQAEPVAPGRERFEAAWNGRWRHLGSSLVASAKELAWSTWQAGAAQAAEQAEPVAWQWLDTSTFRKRLPSNAEPGAWRPLYAANCIK